MLSIEDVIEKAMFFNDHEGTRPVPTWVLESNGRFAGYDAQTVKQALDAFVVDGYLLQIEDGYVRTGKKRHEPR